MKRQFLSFVNWRTILSVYVATMVPASASAQSPMPCRYEVAHIIQAPNCPNGFPPATIGTAISPSGRYVCGYYQSCGFSGNLLFFYDTTNSQFTTLPFPVHNFNWAQDVNEQYVVGQAGGLGFLYHITTGEITTLMPAVPPQVGTCIVNAINSSNVVCGTRTLDGVTQKTTAFRWSTQSGFEDLGLIDGLSTGGSRINDNNVLLGWNGNSVFSRNTRVLVDQKQQTIVLGPIPGGLNSIPQEINNSGSLLLFGQMAEGSPTIPFVVQNQSLQLLLPLSGYDAAAASILTEDHVSMGRSRTLTNPVSYRPTYWVNGEAHDLLDLYPADPDLTINAPVACNPLGYLIVNSTFSSKSYVLMPNHRIAGDTNCDQMINTIDLLNVVTSWGKCAPCDADLNADGLVSVIDLLIVISNWSP